MTTTLTAPTPTTGLRTAIPADVHDFDDRRHEICVDFPVVIDSYRSDFAPNCFEEGWRKRLPVLCVNHNPDKLIGKAVSAQSLPDRHRVTSRFSDFDDVPDARAAWANIRDSIYPGFSFRFVDGRPVPHPTVKGAVRYARATMLETSPVLAPSLPETPLVGFRGRGTGPVAVALARVEAAVRRGRALHGRPATPEEEFEREVLAAVAAQDQRSDFYESVIARIDAGFARRR